MYWQEKLINAVKGRPCLWDKCDENYANKNIKADNWRAISEEMVEYSYSFDEKTCAMKYRNLRDNFIKLRREHLALPSGSSPKAPPKWPFFRLFDFLSDRSNAKSSVDVNVPQECKVKNNVVAAVSSSRQPPAKRRRNETTISKIDSELEKVEQALAAEDAKDEHDYYGSSIAKRLRKLTPHKAALVRVEIEKVFLNVEYNSKVDIFDL
ncbi:hypothetical protein EB796_020450 [Bugula neritina]|uniref:MADF domain-containing protein n=1 Tax=Bugula neritina TaxID=10212 RepID=A0A7J7J532_BUGNE|nr:hypothetical protein EB796_020450 [Bugula neritina]